MKINIELFRKMLEVGSKSIGIEYKYINELNVFPVPDGDTGINLKSTTAGAIKSIKDEKFEDFKTFGDKLSRALLMNARGNSGVIFSQIIRGFCSTFTEKQDYLTIDDVKKAFSSAKTKAYSSVTKPIEGTMLTVVRKIDEFLVNDNSSTIVELFGKISKEAHAAVDSTPEFLEVLSEIGVVDSGAYGVASFIDGMYSVLTNTQDEYLEKIELSLKDKSVKSSDKKDTFDNVVEEEGFGYCSEVILKIGSIINPSIDEKKTNFNETSFRKSLNSIGDSIVMVVDEDLVKVHIHTMKPAKLLTLGQKYGEFEKIKFDNMTNQYLETLNNVDKVDTKGWDDKNVIIATVPTDEISKIMSEDFEVDKTIISHETNNPSTKDYLEKIHELKSKNILIVTDNSNILMAADQVVDLLSNNSEINISIIRATNTFEQINVISHYDKGATFKRNLDEMNKILKKTVSAQISTANKNVKIDNKDIKKNESIAVYNKKIIFNNKDKLKTLKDTFDLLFKKNKNTEICYLIYGKNIKLDVIKAFEKYISEKYGIFTEIKNGNQTIYDAILGLE